MHLLAGVIAVLTKFWSVQKKDAILKDAIFEDGILQFTSQADQK
jgi:hypothetical protein